MELKTLLKYKDIVIQMHDNPDADAVGSGYAMYKYLKKHGKNVRLVYGGKYVIKKSNMVILIDKLKIPAEHVEKLDAPELLLTVDCQYGEGNVTKFEAKNVAMIDHHDTGKESGEYTEIRPYIVSCSTIIYDMLNKSGFDINEDISVATALYYGLMMDSNNFSEMGHPLERDMLDDLIVDKVLIKKLMYSNFTINELETAGIALIRYGYDEVNRVSIIKSRPCDPNILGLIGDLVLQVDTIDVCIIYSENKDGFKLSVRSCVAEVAANDMADFMTKAVGNGGGHSDKAGGYISKEKYEKVHGDLGIESYFFMRMNEYYETFDVIYAHDGIEDNTGFELYEKKDYICGYVNLTDCIPEGMECKIRTLEGDVFVKSSANTILMIGYSGEIYPIKRKVFEEKYTALDEKYVYKADYIPTIRDTVTDGTHEYIKYAKQCISKERSRVYAKKLDRAAKVFAKWNYEKYMMGNIGDYIVYSAKDENDIYIINQEIFSETYEKITILQ